MILFQTKPKDLQLKVNVIMMENLVARGADFVQQLRRSYIHFEQNEDGFEVVRIKGNVHRKTMQGRSANFEPIDKVVHGKAEVLKSALHFPPCFILLFKVEMIKKLVDHLPSVGCKHCIKSDPPQPVAVHKLCVCEDLFLQPLANWRPAAKVWFARERRGNNWHQNVMKTISEETKLSKIYTN